MKKPKRRNDKPAPVKVLDWVAENDVKVAQALAIIPLGLIGNIWGSVTVAGGLLAVQVAALFYFTIKGLVIEP